MFQEDGQTPASPEAGLRPEKLNEHDWVPLK